MQQDRNELLADRGTGLQLGELVAIRRKRFTVVGLTTRMVSPTGDPMVFVPFRDGQDLQFLGSNEAIARQRRRLGAAVERQRLANAVLVSWSRVPTRSWWRPKSSAGWASPPTPAPP